MLTDVKGALQSSFIELLRTIQTAWSKQLKTKIIVASALIVLAFVLSSCGYRNPYVYTGPDKKVYLASWKNRTSELQLESQIYQSLIRWYQKSDSLQIVKNKSDADIVLGGEIVSIDLPSLAYGANNTTKEVKLRLQVRYIMKDITSGAVLFQEPGQVRTEEYTVTGDAATTSDNEKDALETIIDELSQDIYLKTLTKLPKT